MENEKEKIGRKYSGIWLVRNSSFGFMVSECEEIQLGSWRPSAVSMAPRLMEGIQLLADGR